MMSLSRTEPQVDAAYLREAQQVLASMGKTFNWATRFFDRATAVDIAVLYAFCRIVDDIADHQTPTDAAEQLAAIRTDLERGESRLPEVQTFLALTDRRGINREIPQLFVDAIAADTGSVSIETEAELVRYSYGVASTVGLMMCPIMGVRDPVALPFAIDLGVGMQMTNIARDVIEDAQRGRCYLPHDWWQTPLSCQEIVAGSAPARQHVTASRHRLLALADRYYRSADQGLGYIPWRGRMAVATASRAYEAIGGQVKSSSLRWGQRARVSVMGKVWHTARAVSALLFSPPCRPGHHRVHDADLHQALSGLPGTDGGLR